MRPKEKRTITRFGKQLIIQHFILFISITLLLLTGLALKYSGSWLGRTMIFLEGGIVMRGFIHRVAGILLMIGIMYHLLYIIFTREGHEDFLSLMPRLQDIKDYWNSLIYSMGMTEKRPLIGRYGYNEKFQYWSIAFFTLIMVSSGLILWLHNWTMAIFPKWVFDVSNVVHGSGGLLLFIVLIFWHMYAVHLNPKVFPGSLSWLDGKISEREFREEHPGEYKAWESGKSKR